MSDEQKIWFIYLTDHHEGPFTAEEIAEKAKAGLVNGQSLAWKDGMPEWVAAETIPELASGMSGGSAPASEDAGGLSTGSNTSLTPPPSAEAAPAAEVGEVSLAQLLAQSQGGGETVTATGAITDSASVLSSMVSAVHANTTLTKGSVSIGGGISAPSGGGVAEPGTDDEVWTLKIGGQVSGLHSLRRLKALAGSGEIPSDAMVWHAGWSDFQPVASVPQVDSARKAGGGASRPAMMGTRTSISRPGMTMSAQSNSALDNDDEPTDTGIESPSPGGFKGILFKVHTFFDKRKKKADKSRNAKAAAKGKVALAPVGAPRKTASAGGGVAASVKRLVTILFLLAVLGGGGAAAYYFLLFSPIPSSVDVSEEDREKMVEAVMMKPGQGHKLVLAQARGSEENPADPTAPKYYVASNLPEGTKMNMSVTGIPGTLVNKVSFEKTFTATVEKSHLATFDKVSDEGKPLWGEFTLNVTAEGADPLEVKGRFIGLKGAPYQKRLKTYKESVQADYDKEIAELREYITTLKDMQTKASGYIADYKRDWATPSLRAKVTADWANLSKTAPVLLSQLEAPVKARQPGGANEAKFHARAFQDVGTTVGQFEQLLKAHGERLAGATTPSANADELDGLVQAGVQALEAWLAQAVAKTPFDGAKTPDAAAKLPPPPPLNPQPPVVPPPAAAAAPAPTGAH